MSETSLLYWADEAARELYARGARRVWAFGSFGEGFPLDWNSDIDLGVEGLPPELVHRIAAEIDGRSPHKIEVMALEEVTAQVRWFIRRGRVLTPGESTAWRSTGNRWTLRELRLEAVHQQIHEAGARRVLDLGCGKGAMVERLAADRSIECVLGVDRDDQALAEARVRISAAHRSRAGFEHGLFTWRSPTFEGYDAVVALEVVEHLAAPQLAAFVDVIFAFVRPAVVVVTTPNVEYNTLFGLAAGEYRLTDHQFEWTRAQFETWGDEISARYGYVFEPVGVGAVHLKLGAPTQLGRFTDQAAGGN
jgi:2-polyprenyl-3-methyl-5-hydroxy-6-metoxy-1,4-benzoquinol methylase